MMEVLTVISILVFLLALLVPGLGAAREHARRVLCQNNLRQWGIALQCYRDEHSDYLPMEGTYGGTGVSGALSLPGRWFNVLPPYIGAPAYRDVEGANVSIKEFPNLHVWICPSKSLTDVYKSGTGKNQFHYGMNQVLDGMGSFPNGSTDTPGYPDPQKAKHLPAKMFQRRPFTVFLFDIAPNSPRGSPRDVATEYYRDFEGHYSGRFHGDYANFLYINGGVAGFQNSAWVEGNDNRHGRIRWENPQLYWGYPPPKP
ncbi:MAG: DUF1559 domain-containing protein [Phycisphaerales bacterium]|nr:DUF1559 domain-containing protein [Phycisphaerales bacterium]